MKPGQIVYTINARTNTVDEWAYVGIFRTTFNTLVHLRDGARFCFLPKNCVYETKEKAEKIASKK